MPPKDYNALASSVIKILRNIKLVRELTSAARRMAEEEFDLDKTITKYLDVYEQVKRRKTMLIINTGQSNDVIFSIPTLRALKQSLPDIEIVCLIHSRSRCLFGNCPYVDELIVYDSIATRKDIFGFIRINKFLIARKFDLVMDLTNTFATHVLAYLTLAGQRYGFRGRFPTFLINHSIPRMGKVVNSVRKNLMILRLLDIKPKDYRLELWFSEQDRQVIKRFFDDNWIGKEKIALIDISSSIGATRISLAHLAYLCDKLTQYDMRVIVMGTEDTFVMKEELFKKTKSRPLSAVGDIPLTQRAYLIKQCDIYISANPVSLQIAESLKTPSIILSTMKGLEGFPSLRRMRTKKNIEILSDDEIRFTMRSYSKRKQPESNQGRDIVIDKIRNLIDLEL